MASSEDARWITLYSICVYCHGARGCSDILAQFHTTFIVKYHIIVITIYLRPQNVLFYAPARPCAMPNRFARTLTPAHSTRCTSTHTAADKRRKSILCLIYIHTRPTSLRLPLLPNSWFCARFYTLPYNIYNMHNFTTDVIIRDLSHHCPRHPIPPPHSIITTIPRNLCIIGFSRA